MAAERDYTNAIRITVENTMFIALRDGSIEVVHGGFGDDVSFLSPEEVIELLMFTSAPHVRARIEAAAAQRQQDAGD